MRISKVLQALFCAAILVLTARPGMPQAQLPQVKISVTDPSGARITDATVTLSKGNEAKTYKTDDTGVAVAPDLTTGEWTMAVRREGFELQERPLIFQGIDQNVTVILSVAPLKQSVLVETTTEIPSSVQLNASASGGSYLDVAVRDLPFNLTVISQEYMRERGVTNLVDALDLVGGVTTWADTGYIPAVDIRGLSTTDAGIYMANEGIVQNSVPQAARNMDTFFMDRVEVLKGPSSFSYGSGTAGASINTVSKSPRRELGFDTLFAYESYGRTRIGLGVTGPITRSLAARVDYSRAHGGTNVQRTKSTYNALNTGLIWTPLERVTFSGKWIYQTDELSPYFATPVLNRRVDPNVDYIELGANSYLDPRSRSLNYNLENNRNDSINHRGTLITEVDLSHGWKLQNKFYGALLHLDSINREGTSFNQNTLQVTSGTYFFNYKRDWMWGNQADIRNTFRFWNGRSVMFTIGGKIERNNQGRYGSDPALGSSGSSPVMDYLNPIPYYSLHQNYIRTTNADTDYDTGYFEGAFRVTQKLTLSGGARLDHITNSRLTLSTNTLSTISFHPVTGRYALTYQLRPTVTLYVGNSKAIQPAGTGVGSTGATALVNLTGSQAQFTTQPSRGWEGGVKASAWRERVQGTVSYFQMRKYNIQNQELIDGVTYIERVGKIKSAGIDTSFMVTPTRRFTLQADFVWNNARYLVFDTISNGVSVDRSGNWLARVPVVQWSTTPIVRIGPVTGSITFKTRGATWNDSANTQRLPPLTLINSNVTINMAKGVHLTLTGRNLTDEIVMNRGGISPTATSARIGLPRNYSMQVTRTW